MESQRLIETWAVFLHSELERALITPLHNGKEVDERIWHAQPLF